MHTRYTKLILIIYKLFNYGIKINIRKTTWTLIGISTGFSYGIFS
jgi:hypothetical protein